MDALIVNPPNVPYTERSLLIEPIDLLAIATFLESRGYEVGVLDMDVKAQPPESIEDVLKMLKPDFLVIPFDYHVPLHTPEAIAGVKRIIQIAYEHDVRVAVGGKTPKHYPELFLSNEDTVAINGEMEFVLDELLQLGRWNLNALSTVGGITYFGGKTMHQTGPRLEEARLNALPIPNRTLVNIKDYIDVRSLWSSRGCFGECGFCATPDFWGPWRARSAGNVADEIESLVKDYGAKKIIFIDDDATVSQGRMRGISQLVKSRGIDVVMGCLSNASNYDEETMAAMADAGFRWVHYGCETGSQRLLETFKRSTNLDKIKHAVSGSKKLGYRVRTSWIMDLPGSTRETTMETINLILELEPHEVRIHYLVPRVGTELLQKNDNGVPNQYIHSSRPILQPENGELVEDIDFLVRELEKRGYATIREPSQWTNLDAIKAKSPDMKFVSFCPSRYGIGWESAK